MKSTAKTKAKPRAAKVRRTSFEDAEALLNEALKAEPKDLKVPISLRLDGDVYLELKKLSERGLGDGRYQTYLNQILRHFLFGEDIQAVSKSKRKAV